MPALAWFLGIWVTSQSLAGVLMILCAAGIIWALYRWKDFWDVDGVWLGFIPIWTIGSCLLFIVSFWKHHGISVLV